MSRWIAGLPMYNVTPHHGALWRALLDDALAAFARRGGTREVSVLEEPFGELMPLWRRADLLLSQTCGYPFRMLGIADVARLIATPCFDADGCDGAWYSSVLVVSAAAQARGATTLAGCRGLRAACNGDDSHSGMNAFRRAVAPLARGERFFASVTAFGSHRNALDALAAGHADCAAIDCVTFAYLRDALPERLREIRVIGTSAGAPGLPLIASRRLDDRQAGWLRDALDVACSADPARARALRLRGFKTVAEADYDRIARMADEAAALGYPRLA
ncbi:phosphate/phosphite/phosphonate ABC transporter substrate-binding protein [Burkholderia plantarii]|uniref:ABC phosphate/phosphonate transporter, periplasmic ligand binding protein n=1 Tax=Burkholderia plantarii TaxID=41899 RepID=A0A0B6RQM8_BURPL|nr:PhnD/SsuA/transferrin family substrate-binding protein [Burkholderia plantarii]AJK47652.1 ABC phosphate/phosphonate transporter, periplasmic ligand binding protein [Burkholderia plantarii]